jgi:hypothetical protein
MQSLFKKTGGARIGWINASWPLAQLSATQDKLTVKSFVLGEYTFTPEQVSMVERYVRIPVLAWGIRVRHCIPDYPQQIIFWSLGSPDEVIAGIQNTGFIPAGSSSTNPVRQGIPIKWSAIIAAIVIWNALFMLPLLGQAHTNSAPNGFIVMPLIAAFAFSIGVLRSPTLQRLVLKPDRHVGEIRPLLLLLSFISGLLFVVFSILLASGAFNQASMHH